MESTMAVDYAHREDWEETWKQGRRPYFIHYAGGRASSQFLADGKAPAMLSGNSFSL
jgi:hypothetical protein